MTARVENSSLGQMACSKSKSKYTKVRVTRSWGGPISWVGRVNQPAGSSWGPLPSQALKMCCLTG